jgi:hypothetical protein
MEKQILQSVDNVWRHHFSTIEEALDETTRGLKNLLRLDDYHRHGHDEPQLEKTLGPFGSTNLDLSSLSQVLGKNASTRNLPDDRLQRVHRLLEKLKEIKKTGSEVPSTYPSITIDEEETVIHEKAEAHLNQMADIFRNLRIAQLEICSKYHADTHDPVFEDFNWRQLSPAELRLCPPFLIIAQLGSKSGPTLRKIMSLLESRKPIKIAAMRTTLRKTYSPTSDPSVPATMAVEMLPLAMRGVYFLQTSIAEPDFDQRLFDALTSPRPSLLSLLAQETEEGENAFKLRAKNALQSRAFPGVIYDPDLASRFVSCFDLSANPKTEDEYTFANFAANDKEFVEEFTDPAAEITFEDLIPIGDFLALTRHQRVGKFPVLYLPGDDEKIHPKIVSQAVVTQTSDQMHLWKTLQEIAGEDNPYVNTTKATMQAEFGVQQKALFDSLQQDKAEAKTHSEKVAVAATVRKLVSHFTGVDPTEINLENLIAAMPGSEKNKK